MRPLGIVPPLELDDEGIKPQSKPMPAKMEWYDIAPKSMLAGAIILFAGVIGGLFARLEGKASDEVMNLKRAVDQAEDNYRNRVAERVATTEAKVTSLEKSMGKLTDAVEDNTRVNSKVLQELARVRGVLVAKGIDRSGE